VAYLFLTARAESWLRSVTKTAAVALLALAALVLGLPALLVLALAACALGDLLLSRDGETAFMGGVGAFALGHLFYIALFLSQPEADPSRLLAWPAALAAVGLFLLGGLAARSLAPKAGALKGPVLAYIPIILGMGLAALTLGEGRGLILAAAFAFVFSDLILATEKFLLPGGHGLLRWTPYAIWVLYWGAQFGFFAAFA
jgi:uncharacterized membrane protein YhhN